MMLHTYMFYIYNLQIMRERIQVEMIKMILLCVE